MQIHGLYFPFIFDITENCAFGSLEKLILRRVSFIGTSALIFSDSSLPVLKILALEHCQLGLAQYPNIGCPFLQSLVFDCTPINGLDISCPRLKPLEVRKSFYNGKNESWVKIFAPKLKDFPLGAERLTKETFSGQLSFPGNFIAFILLVS